MIYLQGKYVLSDHNLTVCDPKRKDYQKSQIESMQQKHTNNSSPENAERFYKPVKSIRQYSTLNIFVFFAPENCQLSILFTGFANSIM